MIFALVQHHKWSISEIENLMPYERDLYFAMVQVGDLYYVKGV